MYLIVREDTIHHEGDERSRTHPGHGYPAYSEVVSRVSEYRDLVSLQQQVEYLLSRGYKFKVYEAKELKITQKVSIGIE